MKIKLSKITVALGVFIIISASFTRQIMNLIKVYIGDKGFIILISSILLFSVLSFLIFVVRNSHNFIKASLLIAVLIAVLILSWKMKIPEERIHILEFAMLGWLSSRDLIKVNIKAKGAILACLFTVSAGILDELFQAILPYRFFQVSDIVLNSLGGGLGVILYILS